MFIDLVSIKVRAGNGGNGAVRFRREKYVPDGGPDGGDGGKGGDVIFTVEPGMSTLIDFRYNRKYRAEDGADGEGGNCAGRKGKDTLIKVPPGTLIKDAGTGAVLSDMDVPGKTVVIAAGGAGGKGNRHFANSVRQAPAFATPGEPGQDLEVVLELKLIADVGLVGFPNAGKSTLISAATQSRPRIANYPFTTLEPNLGVVKLGMDSSFVMADIPGIIEGASGGAGLGLEFLRHIERTRLLFLIIDLTQIDGYDVIYAYENLYRELAVYSKRLAERPRFIVGSKNDISGTEENEDRLRRRAARDGLEFFSISAVTGKGVTELLGKAYDVLGNLPKPAIFDENDEEVVFSEKKEQPFTVRLENGIYIIDGPFAKKLFMSVNFDDRDSLGYFQRVLRNKGIISELESLGIREGDTVRICDMEFEYLK